MRLMLLHIQLPRLTPYCIYLQFTLIQLHIIDHQFIIIRLSSRIVDAIATGLFNILAQTYASELIVIYFYACIYSIKAISLLGISMYSRTLVFIKPGDG